MSRVAAHPLVTNGAWWRYAVEFTCFSRKAAALARDKRRLPDCPAWRAFTRSVAAR